MTSPMEEDRYGIAFFDLETTRPTPSGQDCVILEFGSIVVCPKTLEELDSYHELVRPSDLSLVPETRSNGITRDAVASAPPFADIADRVYDLLHGRIWAGHNILEFDCPLIREAFVQIGRPAPRPKRCIDTLEVLTQEFGRRAGDMKMASLARYFGLGKQTHRSLEDVQMNLEVVKYCATVLFLESILQEPFNMNALENEIGEESLQRDNAEERTPAESSAPQSVTTNSPFLILHKDIIVLKLACSNLKVRFGVSRKYLDQAGRPLLSIVVDAPPSLCQVLDACDSHAQSFFMQSGSTSDWRPLVTRKSHWNNPTIRLHIPTIVTGEVAKYGTEICHKETGVEERIPFSRFDPSDLDALFYPLNELFYPGVVIDAHISLNPYDYKQKAGIKLEAEKLVIISK